MFSISLKKFSFFTALAAAFMLLIGTLFSTPAVAAQTKGQQLVSYAQKFKGTPFRWGGTSTKGFDASGYTQYVFKNSVKVTIPRTSTDQYKVGQSIKLNQLQPGDLLFYYTNGKSVSFVAIYIGNQQFIGATSDGVKIQSMKSSYWSKRYIAAKRIVN